MLASDLALLRDTFDSWCRGAPVTADDWAQFRRDLHTVTRKAVLAELGSTVGIFEVLTECMKADTNVRLLPTVFGPARREGGRP